MSLYNDLTDVLTPYANKIKEVNESLGDVSDELELITAAVPEDVGNALTVKRVAGGKVVEWDFSPAGSSSSGMSEEIKSALLNFLSCVTLSDLNGVGYYNTLYGLLVSDANVLSIDAVFTQGQTIVYNTSNLQDLRSMLVVTATYDDESTRVITEYALRGTLNVGDSTITVVYGKKTDTFTVHVTDVDAPPAGYTKIDWVWADNAVGDSASRWTFVKSGYTPSPTTGIETKFEYNSLIGNGRLFDAGNYRLWLNKNVTINRCGTEVVRNNAIPNIAVNTPMEFSLFMNNTDDVVMDGNTLFSVSSGESTAGEMIFFTSGSSDAVKSDAKIYYVKFYENGSLVRNYIPCKRDSDDVIGLYETITGTFHVGERNPLKGPES